MSDSRFVLDGTVAVIGGGKMGEAIVAGLIGSGAVVPANVTISEPSEARRLELSAAHAVKCVADNREAVRGADIVLIAVKPQIIEDVVSGFSDRIEGALVVSVAAGVSCARLESMLPAGTAVVRVMPNTPALAGEGMSVISGGEEAKDAHVDEVRALFSTIGRAVVLDERHQDAATAISGSGPAYVAIFADALIRAGVRHGLPRDVAAELAIQTIKGTAVLLERGGQHPEQLADEVSSPGGTTIAALEALESRGLRSAIADAVSAAVARSKELGS